MSAVEPQYRIDRHGPDIRRPGERAGDVKHRLADISEAKRVIGCEPKIMFDEGLRLSIEWFKQSAR